MTIIPYEAKQLSLIVDPSDIELNDGSISNSDIETKNLAVDRYLTNSCHAKNAEFSVNKYKSSKCDRQYFRLSWRVGRKMKHLHIPGGSTISELAQFRARKLQEMIDRGAELGEVLAAVKTYRSTGTK